MRTARQPSSQNGTLRGELVNRVMKDIFSGTLAGGDRLVEQELALRYGVSRTPIREALGELAAMGVIRLKPNHGAVVCPFGAEQIIEDRKSTRLNSSHSQISY